MILSAYPATAEPIVLIWSSTGHRYAIEIQHTPIELDQIEARTQSYHGAGIAVIWVALIKPSFWEKAEKATEGCVNPSYSARPWERWAHGFNYGQLWFYDPAAKALWRGRFEKHEIQVEATSWYDSDGNENYRGGYTRISKRWKELTLQGPFSLDQVKIEQFSRKAAALGSYNYPAGRAARLLA
jgi:competence protein CoiA